MKRVLVTGAQGQLGKCLQNASKGYAKIEFIFKDSKALNILDFAVMETLFAKEHYDYCINCAAYTNVQEAEKRPEKAMALNATAVQNLATCCKISKTILIHISTDYVFDGEKEEAYTIADQPNPINVYGRSKLLGEQWIQEIMSRYFIVRTSWLYSEHGKNFYKTIVAKAKEEAILYVTDEQRGCPTNANNLATYLAELIANSNKSFGIHHFTDGEAMTWFSFAKKILVQNGLDTTTSVKKAENNRSFVKRPKNSVLK